MESEQECIEIHIPDWVGMASQKLFLDGNTLEHQVGYHLMEELGLTIMDDLGGLTPFRFKVVNKKLWMLGKIKYGI